MGPNKTVHRIKQANIKSDKHLVLWGEGGKQDWQMPGQTHPFKEEKIQVIKTVDNRRNHKSQVKYSLG